MIMMVVAVMVVVTVVVVIVVMVVVANNNAINKLTESHFAISLPFFHIDIVSLFTPH